MQLLHAINHPSASVHFKMNVLCRLFAHKQALAATANAILLQKCLKQRIWDNSGVECMQLQGVGDKTSKLLAAAKLSKLRQLDAADPRKIEAVTQRKYPFGKSCDSASDHKGCPAYAFFGSLIVPVASTVSTLLCIAITRVLTHGLTFALSGVPAIVTVLVIMVLSHAGDTLKQQLHSIMPPQMNLSISATGANKIRLLMSVTRACFCSSRKAGLLVSLAG